MKFNKYTGKLYPEDSDFEGMPVTVATILTFIFGIIVIGVAIAIVL